VNQGGAGLIIYRTSEACPRTGVNVGDNFFPGYSGISKDAQIFIAFFALRYDQGPGTKLSLAATDQAGNNSQVGFYYHIRRKTFRKDKINISDGFLNRKLPEFPSVIAQKAGSPPVDMFLAINRDMRKADYQKIVGLVQKTDNQIHWQGRFARLPKSATRSGFADQRTYTYKGKVIDHQVHLGVDLASLARSPVPAANSGIVVFADNLGIYGKTVFVDHGFNLFSAYSHLSSIAVSVGDRLTKGQKIGQTGKSGLAGGDHLHYGMLVYNTFVNPVEWWDSKWIINNVTSKLESVEGITKQE
jgi:murein DD-endopeptidase MepM/ murein hydrolase activator NlpD